MFEYKQVIAVREDLGMSPGKLAAQVAHASLSAAEYSRENKKEWYEDWKKERQKKVVVKVSSKEKVEALKEKADRLNLPNYLISDAGLTELEPETKTTLAVGPGPNEEIDKVTGDLQLLR